MPALPFRVGALRLRRTSYLSRGNRTVIKVSRVRNTRKYISHCHFGPPRQPSSQVLLCCSGSATHRIPYQRETDKFGGFPHGKAAPLPPEFGDDGDDGK